MGALPNKKSSVVAIETARRRRRQPAGPDKPNPPSINVVAFALALIIALAATTFGLWIVVEFVRRGNYVGAAVAPFWVILPGCAPLAVLLVKRRRAARTARANVTRLTASPRQSKPHPGNRS
jgi:protein-S-isoprenylcysteine O-methyltransferase Ste14